MIFYNYFRSSASYRVRIALELKGMKPEKIVDIDLRQNEQKSAAYRKIAPSALVPTFQFDDLSFSQSIALIEWMDAKCPEPRLIPENPEKALAVREIAFAIACDIHPLNNLRVLNYLTGTLEQSEDVKNQWYAHWVQAGFDGVEDRLNRQSKTSQFAFGDAPTLADICIVPQVFNAERFNVDLTAYPRILQITEQCNQLAAFQAASPDNH
jgi:maleylacetoacetate isomerase